MKELSTEEKAKRYDEAFKEASVAHKDEDRHLKATLERIFPELPESDGDRIRKEIIEYIKDQQSSFISAPDCRDKYEEEENNKYNSWIAWLEKQGEHKNYIDAIQVGDKVTRNRDGVLINLSQLKRVANKDEKQGEQKPVIKMKTPEESLAIDSETYNKIVDECVYELEKQKPADKVEPKFHKGDWVVIKQ